ncbi:MAG: hypothetical protein ACXWXX_15380 [Candidatus Binatia bacterium]
MIGIVIIESFCSAESLESLSLFFQVSLRTAAGVRINENASGKPWAFKEIFFRALSSPDSRRLPGTESRRAAFPRHALVSNLSGEPNQAGKFVAAALMRVPA